MATDKICYTALFGNHSYQQMPHIGVPSSGPYEDLKPPTVASPGWRFVCFTDQEPSTLEGRGWEIINVGAAPDGDPVRRARKVKLMPHLLSWLRGVDTIWLDASFQININLQTVWDNYFTGPMTVPVHRARNDIFQEIQSCLVNGRGEAALLIQQEEAYKKIDPPLPRCAGLITSGFIMRQHTLAVVSLCEAWWDELNKWSSRDQVAFAYLEATRPDLCAGVVNKIPWDYSQSKELKYFKHYKHRH